MREEAELPDERIARELRLRASCRWKALAMVLQSEHRSFLRRILENLVRQPFEVEVAFARILALVDRQVRWVHRCNETTVLGADCIPVDESH